MNYLICEISGRQYLIEPDKIIEVDKLAADTKFLVVDKVLLSADGGKVEIGKPYLPRKVNLEVLGVEKKAKIRVATYKAKANYRRVKGQRRQVSKVRMTDKTEKKSVKKA